MCGGQRKVIFFHRHESTCKKNWKLVFWDRKFRKHLLYFLYVFKCPNFRFFSPKTATVGGRSSFLSNFFWPAMDSHPHPPKFWLLLNSGLKNPAFENFLFVCFIQFFPRLWEMEKRVKGRCRKKCGSSLFLSKKKK